MALHDISVFDKVSKWIPEKKHFKEVKTDN